MIDIGLQTYRRKRVGSMKVYMVFNMVSFTVCMYLSIPLIFTIILVLSTVSIGRRLHILYKQRMYHLEIQLDDDTYRYEERGASVYTRGSMKRMLSLRRNRIMIRDLLEGGRRDEEGRNRGEEMLDEESLFNSVLVMRREMRSYIERRQGESMIGLPNEMFDEEWGCERTKIDEYDLTNLPTMLYRDVRTRTEGAKEGGEGEGMRDDACSICYRQYEDDEYVRRLGCAHYYHISCIDRWILQKNSCPICKCEVIHK